MRFVTPNLDAGELDSQLSELHQKFLDKFREVYQRNDAVISGHSSSEMTMFTPFNPLSEDVSVEEILQYVEEKPSSLISKCIT